MKRSTHCRGGGRRWGRGGRARRVLNSKGGEAGEAEAHCAAQAQAAARFLPRSSEVLPLVACCWTEGPGHEPLRPQG
jgi:hypothetical protein